MRSVAFLMAMCAGAVAGGEPPAKDDCVECTLETDFLWPPNHNLVSVGLQVNGISDPTITVYSDEDDVWPASAQFSPDAKFDECQGLRLRSERGGPGDGRVYLIVVQGDQECVLTVVVPHDLSSASIASVLDQADAAREFFLANGFPPPGFFVVGDGPVIGPKQ